MAINGINYDTGTRTLRGGLTRETFDEDFVRQEIRIIKDELHCNAIRISGVEIDRMVKASEMALEIGLAVWFSPSLQYDNQENTLAYIIKGAAAAEELRARFPELVFVLGCEFSLFTEGFINGKTGEERMRNMFSPISMLKNILGIKRSYNTRLGKYLKTAMQEVRKQFKGDVTYASGSWEKVDWDLFDIVGVDHYRSVFNKAVYVKELQKYNSMGKPLSIMEFGCCAYKGAENKGAMGWAIVDWKKSKPELKENFIRDEGVQSKYLLDLLKIFDQEKVYGRFIFTFISPGYVYHSDPRFDLDMAAYGIVKSIENRAGVYKNLPWLPKLAFFSVGEYYKNQQG